MLAPSDAGMFLLRLAFMINQADFRHRISDIERFY